jgi:O-antigen ligase
MFKDHPLFGVGLNGYRESLQGPYSDFLPRLATIFLSHSTVITIMAELGVLGLSVLAFLGYRFVRLCWRLYVEAGRADRALVAGLTGAALAIFISSQSEARLIEDPYLWIVLGLVAALGAIRRQEQVEARAEPPSSR